MFVNTYSYSCSFFFIVYWEQNSHIVASVLGSYIELHCFSDTVCEVTAEECLPQHRIRAKNEPMVLASVVSTDIQNIRKDSYLPKAFKLFV